MSQNSTDPEMKHIRLETPVWRLSTAVSTDRCNIESEQIERRMSDSFNINFDGELFGL
jgi:hypothetical protein